MNKYRFLWVYYEFYDYIYGVCSEVQKNEKMAKEMTLFYIRRIYSEMGNNKTKQEISEFVNKMMIELATNHWYELKREKEQRKNQYRI